MNQLYKIENGEVSDKIQDAATRVLIGSLRHVTLHVQIWLISR